MRSKDHHLHQDKVAHGRTRNGAELGDKNVRSECGKAKLNDHDRDKPIVQGDEAVLDQLFCIVFAPAAKNPKLVQQEMTGGTDKIGDRNSDQR